MTGFLMRLGIWINERTGGREGQLLCARCAASDCRFCRWLCAVMNRFDKDHCEKMKEKS